MLKYEVFTRGNVETEGDEDTLCIVQVWLCTSKQRGTLYSCLYAHTYMPSMSM
jgi:hypothetical protein